jgi:hypothetical protein
MEVQVIQHFLDQEKGRRNGRPIVINSLRNLHDHIVGSPLWPRGRDTVRGTAIPRCFSYHAGHGPRIIAIEVPPLRLLDVGEHNPTYKAWSSAPTIQVRRYEKIVETPEWISEIFNGPPQR